KLERRFREQKWALLRKAEQARTPPDQIPLTPQEYAVFVEAAYDAAVRSASVSNRTETARPLPARATGSPAADIACNTKDQKGATGLLQSPLAEPTTTVNERERLVLSTIPIADVDLTQLASQRARNTHQRILDTGKVEESRLILVDLTTSPSTNHASR